MLFEVILFTFTLIIFAIVFAILFSHKKYIDYLALILFAVSILLIIFLVTPLWRIALTTMRAIAIGIMWGNLPSWNGFVKRNIGKYRRIDSKK